MARGLSMELLVIPYSILVAAHTNMFTLSVLLVCYSHPRLYSSKSSHFDASRFKTPQASAKAPSQSQPTRRGGETISVGRGVGVRSLAVSVR